MYTHPDDVSDARMRRHYLLVLVFEAAFVALLWLFSRTFA
jgi:hypothetical protein